jgi:hypothetical protein
MVKITGGDAMSAGDEGNAVEQCTNDQLRASICRIPRVGGARRCHF